MEPDPRKERTWIDQAREYYRGHEKDYEKTTHDAALQLAQQVGYHDDHAIRYAASRLIDRFNKDGDWNLNHQRKPESNPSWWREPRIFVRGRDIDEQQLPWNGNPQVLRNEMGRLPPPSTSRSQTPRTDQDRRQGSISTQIGQLNVSSAPYPGSISSQDTHPYSGIYPQAQQPSAQSGNYDSSTSSALGNRTLNQVYPPSGLQSYAENAPVTEHPSHSRNQPLQMGSLPAEHPYPMSAYAAGHPSAQGAYAGHPSAQSGYASVMKPSSGQAMAQPRPRERHGAAGPSGYRQSPPPSHGSFGPAPPTSGLPSTYSQHNDPRHQQVPKQSNTGGSSKRKTPPTGSPSGEAGPSTSRPANIHGVDSGLRARAEKKAPADPSFRWEVECDRCRAPEQQHSRKKPCASAKRKATCNSCHNARVPCLINGEPVSSNSRPYRKEYSTVPTNRPCRVCFINNIPCYPCPRSDAARCKACSEGSESKCTWLYDDFEQRYYNPGYLLPVQQPCPPCQAGRKHCTLRKLRDRRCDECANTKTTCNWRDGNPV